MHTPTFSELMKDRQAATRAKQPMGTIYYVSFGEDGPVKIGYSADWFTLGERLRGLQTACPYPLHLLAAKAGKKADERQLHDRFRKKRIRGEWFTRHPDLMRHINGVRRRNDCKKARADNPQYANPGANRA